MSEPSRIAVPLDLKPLTTLRIMAALWVVLADYWPDLKGAGAPPPLIASGLLGVELFFVLSGFILCHVYLEAFAAERFRYVPFLWARLARIYPLHIATLAAVAVMGGAAMVLHQPLSHAVLYWPALGPNLLLTNAWGFNTDAGWNHPAWSISAEWFAYLMFPLFALSAWGMRRRPVLAVASTVLLLAVIYPAFERLAGFKLTNATIQWGALRIVPCFALGCAIYLLWRSRPIRTPRTAVLAAALAFTTAIALVAASAPTALIVACFGGLILSLASLTSTGSRGLSGPVGVYLGEVSFAVYMVAIPWKMLALSGAQKLAHIGQGGLPWPLWALYFAGVIPVAMVAHHLVERPARAAMRKWTPRLPTIRSFPPRGETSRNIA